MLLLASVNSAHHAAPAAYRAVSSLPGLRDAFSSASCTGLRCCCGRGYVWGSGRCARSHRSPWPRATVARACALQLASSLKPRLWRPRPRSRLGWWMAGVRTARSLALRGHRSWRRGSACTTQRACARLAAGMRPLTTFWACAASCRLRKRLPLAPWRTMRGSPASAPVTSVPRPAGSRPTSGV